MYDNVFDNKGLNEITLKLKEDIKKNTAQNSPIYDLWFSEMSVLRMTDMIIFISVNTDMQKLTIEYKYMHLITDAVKKIYGLDLKVGIYYTQDGKITKEQMDADEKRILLDDIDEDSIGNNKDKKNTGAAAVKKDFSTGPKQNIDNLGLLGLDIEPGEESEILMKHKYTFSNFVVGSSNRFAYKACTMVAQYPAVKYNPFFIHGPSGLGKTHLLCAISNEYARRFKHAKVIYVNGEDFANELIDHITEKNPKKAQQFRDKYRGCDMLLIDDIHFIAGKPSTQEEIFHTFNTLYEAGKQIILTSDRPPKDINLLEERIKSRFESGLIVDIQPPDLELRIAILKRKAEDTGIKITNEVLFFLAENISSNIRQIEGAIKKLNAYSYIHNSEITLELAKSSIADILSGTEPLNVTVEKVLAAVSQAFSVPQADLKSRRRTKEISFARNVAIYIIRTISKDLSYPAIGKLFDRNHSTIISSFDSIEEELKNNPALDMKIKDITSLVKG